MKIEKALNLLGLKKESTLQELNYSFRQLAKRYHPDFNSGKEEWANSMMTQVNLAYEVALEYLAQYKECSMTGGREDAGPLQGSFLMDFNRAMNKVLDGVYMFYQYGLENIHMRKEGVRKFRYRDSLRIIQKGIERLEGLNNDDPLKSRLMVFRDFSKAFLKNMHIDRIYMPSSNPDESSAYRHYREGSILLDNAIKLVFFRDILLHPMKDSVSTLLEKSNEEFMSVLARYYRSSWITETVMKVYLLDLLDKIINVFKKLKY
ncbi:MAG: J domain-containing protein [Spirochaetota bacterium]|nr:MAG: J domain-containing protein [Spirochaetota bacterium]